MEDLVKFNLFNNTFRNKKVLITGHTGFKGSWLALWLKLLGAEVIGYSLNPPTEPSHFSLLNLEIHNLTADILDEKYLNEAFMKYQPEIVFHLAAQSLVRASYKDPVLTYKTNVLGTLNVLEACKKTPSVKIIINVTSDKCYLNKESLWGYRETDEIGGFDPYSSSKACSELLTNSFRNSYFNLKNFNDHGVALASVRAGNVIGGGDWAEDRLIPDIIRAVTSNSRVNIRNPKSTRPWQHVLEPLSGYLLLAAEIANNNYDYSQAWNFGPNNESSNSVEDIVKKIKVEWPALEYEITSNYDQPHEAIQLRLDCTKAATILRWQPIWNSDKSVLATINWYKKFYIENKILSIENILEYVENAAINHAVWTL